MNHGKYLKLRFNEKEDLQSHIQKSINFVNQMYGASVSQIKDIIRGDENFDNVP
jgi:hypothetical protein